RFSNFEISSKKIKRRKNSVCFSGWACLCWRLKRMSKFQLVSNPQFADSDSMPANSSRFQLVQNPQFEQSPSELQNFVSNLGQGAKRTLQVGAAIPLQLSHDLEDWKNKGVVGLAHLFGDQNAKYTPYSQQI